MPCGSSDWPSGGRGAGVSSIMEWFIGATASKDWIIWNIAWALRYSNASQPDGCSSLGGKEHCNNTVSLDTVAFGAL